MSIPLLFAKRGFHPRQIFAALQGAWLEPVVGNIWQEHTGINPTTTGGQTIGRIADLSGYGNVATQPTAANRPVLGRRYNLLTYSEDFANAIWRVIGTGGGAVAIKTPNYGIAPDGTQTACRVQLDVSGGSEGAASQVAHTYNALVGNVTTQSAWIKTNNGATVTIKGFTAASSTPNLLTITGDWQRFAARTTPASTIFNLQILLIKGTTSDTADLLVWHPQAEVGSTATTYQRITTANDYDYGQYPAAIHDATDSLVVSLPNLGGGTYSSSGSVYFATPQGMSALHGQSMETAYTLPALSTDIYSWIVVPQRLNTALEGRLERYMLRKARLALPDYLTDDLGEILTDDIGDPLLAG